MSVLLLGSAVVIGALAAPPAAAVVGHDPEAPGHSGFTVTPPTDAYLMAFHTCAADCEDPANHLIHLTQSNDGATWVDVPGWQAYRGSVPDVTRRDETAYVVGAGLTTIDLATGAATAHRITVTKQDGSPAMPRDMAFAGQLADGRFVITYVPPMQEVVGASSVPVYLATEVPDTDGTRFVMSGTAITVPNGVAGTIGQATDPDVFFNGSAWVLYVSVGSNVVAFTSDTVTGPYDLASATLISQNAGGVPAGIRTPDGVWTFVTGGPSRDSLVIRRAVTPDGLTPVAASAFSTVVTGDPYGATTAESPGVAANVPGIPCGPGCGTAPAVTRPDPVRDVAVTKRSRTSATVAWRPPASDGGGAITSYTSRIRVGTGSWSRWTSQPAVEGASRLSRTWKHLPSGQRCTAEIRAANSAGTSTSVRISFRTLPRR